ncbi:MAG TPA: Druantia anti-phage system protein DruA [Verrucomicrobiae bacterium]|nr:Druantia anti-phage system protein DruA [Verrucomicrobiae bacterium]
MSVHLFDGPIRGRPPEPLLLEGVTVRLIEESERDRFDQELITKHYLKNANAVGCVLRYVAEYVEQWVALLVFCSPALHLKLRDQWLKWTPRQVKERRHLVAQNARFLVLGAPGQWPNLASRVLKLVAQRLAQDWQEYFGYPVLAMETFVDPQRFHGTCYKAAGWQQLGPTQGCERDWRDFYTDTKHPKQLWVRALGEAALEQARAAELPDALADPQGPLPPPCPVSTGRLDSLRERFHHGMTDPRKPRGVRHKLASTLTLIALAVVAGCKGPHAIAEFANSLTHPQRGRLRCRPRRGRSREYDVPSERTIRRILKKVDCQELKQVVVSWMAAEDPSELKLLHLDGKVVKNAEPAPARSAAQQAQAAAAEPSEVPAELQKPKADKALILVNFQTTSQRLVDQLAVPRDTNEEAAVAAHLPKMDLAGVCITSDAAHTVKANCRQLSQNNGAEFFLFLKGNQPTALAKAEQLLPGNTPPSGQHAGQGSRAN